MEIVSLHAASAISVCLSPKPPHTSLLPQALAPPRLLALCRHRILCICLFEIVLLKQIVVSCRLQHQDDVKNRRDLIAQVSFFELNEQHRSGLLPVEFALRTARNLAVVVDVMLVMSCSALTSWRYRFLDKGVLAVQLFVLLEQVLSSLLVLFELLSPLLCFCHVAQHARVYLAELGRGQALLPSSGLVDLLQHALHLHDASRQPQLHLLEHIDDEGVEPEPSDLR
eukprot:746504-Hanusia_phi.AAC.9